MRFFLDTSVLFLRKKISELATLAGKNGHKLVVSSLAHSERVSQLKRDKGDNFDIEEINAFIETHNIEVVSFQRLDAEKMAQYMGHRFPDSDIWQDIKWQRCMKAIGNYNCLPKSRPKSRRCSATVDWFIAAHALGDDNAIVTKDGGIEFSPTEIELQVLNLEQALKLASQPGDTL